MTAASKPIKGTVNPSASARERHGVKPEPEHSTIREWADELIFVFTVVLFIKMFLVEIYKIPSGSMTPTLLGGDVAHVDVNNDRRKDIVFFEKNGTPNIFVRGDQRYIHSDDINITADQIRNWRNQGRISEQFDRILVNKLAYIFSPPKRGDIVVFKVPPRIFRVEAPIYIKRCAGEPGDHLAFTEEGRLIANGKVVEQPDFYRTQHYDPSIPRNQLQFTLPYIQYNDSDPFKRRLAGIDVPPGEFFVCGDNAQGSLDSRFWGTVPFNHFKGRAFMRIFPLGQIKFLK
jgi:signal peptidase I